MYDQAAFLHGVGHSWKDIKAARAQTFLYHQVNSSPLKGTFGA
jgi:hypothetical protein